MRSNKNLKRERSDGILKESKSSDDLKKYQECAKKLDECSKNLLRLCQYTNQGIYDDEIERAANEILKKEEAEAKRIADELRHQKGVLNRTQGSNRNLNESSSRTLRESSKKELMYSGPSTKNPNFSNQNQCNERGADNYTFPNREVSQPRLPCGEQRPADFLRSNITPQPAPYDTGIASMYCPGNSTSLYPSGSTTNAIRYGPCSDAGTGPNYFGSSPYGNQGNTTSQWRDYQRPNAGDTMYSDASAFRPGAESAGVKRGYFPTQDPSSTWDTRQNMMGPSRDFNSSFSPGGRNPVPSACDLPNLSPISRAKSQTTLTSNGKTPIHILITAMSDGSTTLQQQPCREPLVTDYETNRTQNTRNSERKDGSGRECNNKGSKGQEGDSYLSKEDANHNCFTQGISKAADPSTDWFLQCVLNCWNQMNKNIGPPKESKTKESLQADKNCSKSRLIEFCCNLSSRSNKKKKDSKKRGESKSKNKTEECQRGCFVCTPVECPDGDGHSSKNKEQKFRDKSKGKDWQAECQKILKEFSAYKKNKAKKQKQTTSRGSDPDPCYEVQREIYSMNQDPCTEYFNNTQDPYESWGQHGTNWSNSWGNEYPCSSPWQHGWGGQAPPGESYGNTGAWSNPQNLVCTPANRSPATSRASSQTNLKTTSSDMDTSMLLAIARAAINLSMEHQKGESGPRKDKRNNSSDDDDEDDTSFCDMLESIFGQ